MLYANLKHKWMNAQRRVKIMIIMGALVILVLVSTLSYWVYVSIRYPINSHEQPAYLTVVMHSESEITCQ